MSAAYTCEMKQTTSRKASLERYYESSILGPAPEYEIRCPSFRRCRESGYSDEGLYFFPAQLSHVGRRYELLSESGVIRIVVAPKDYGANDHYEDTDREGRVPVSERIALIEASAEAGFHGRNPHMRGTTLVLQEILGLAAENEHILVDGAPTHVFDAFAMVNVLLCSRCDSGRNSRATRAMYLNCVKHFVEAIRILQPTILVFQGVSLVGLFLGEVKETQGVEVQQLSAHLHELHWRGVCMSSATVGRFGPHD